MRKLDANIDGWIQTRGHYEAMIVLQQAEVRQVRSSPSRSCCRSALAANAAPGCRKRIRMPGPWIRTSPPWLLARTPGKIRMPATGFGDHNCYGIRDDLGCYKQRVERVYAEGVTADQPDASLHA